MPGFVLDLVFQRQKATAWHAGGHQWAPIKGSYPSVEEARVRPVRDLPMACKDISSFVSLLSL